MHSKWGQLQLCRLSALLLFAAIIVPARADELKPVQWRNATSAAVTTATTTASANAVLAGGTPKHVVVQFAKMPSPDQREAMRASGMTLLSYLGNNAFFALTSGTTPALTTAQNASLAVASDIQLGHKLHPMLLKGSIPDYAKFPVGSAQSKDALTTDAGNDFVAVYVIFHPDVDLATAGAAALTRHGGKIRDYLYSINGVVAWLPTNNLQTFTMEDEVQWVEPPLPPLATNNDSNRVITQADTVQAAPYNLSGSGIKVLVYDGGTALASHGDFGDRLTVHDSSGTIDHATHVSGTIGGSGALSSGQYRGMAPAVTIESYGFQYDGTGQFLYTNPGDMEADYGEAVNTYGAVVANSSIGTNTAGNGYSCDWEGDYGATDMVIDAMVRGSLGSPMRIIWANGNERGSGRCGTTYHTTAPPACAKNHIAVGAINSNDDSMTSFSSWGPSDDGRLKPDIVGPGCQSDGDGTVTSTVTSGGYSGMCGTSMAAPTVTGLCSLILQDYKAQFPGVDLPRNSTLKVLLAQYAVDLGAAGPDYKFGYGSVRVQTTIDGMRRQSFIEASVDHAEQKIYFVNVPAGASQLTATIAWDDPPGSPNVTPELVNDLDLLAVAPDGTTLAYPWTLDPANPSAAAVRTGADHVNNIEQVVVDSPAQGVWQLRVTGYNVPSGPQVFSLVTTPDMQLCASAGVVSLNSLKYACNTVATVTVVDCDLNTNPNTSETVQVNIASSSEPGGEILTLTEGASNSAVFTGSITLSPVNATGVLQVNAGDTVTATYIDADDGQGNANVAVTSNASVDCTSPAISGVTITNVGAVSATVNFATNEAARGTVRYGTACSQLIGNLTDVNFETGHSLKITGLSPMTTYFLEVEAQDDVGNTATDSNAGNCYTFTTGKRGTYWTQLFTSTSKFDLAGRSMVFTPDGSSDYYTACADSITSLPVDPSASTSLTLADDGYAQITLSGGKKVSLYGVQYGTAFVGSNGYITFGAGSTAYAESTSTHFQLPRVSVLFDDLNPASVGSVKWLQTTDALVVTWEGVPEFGVSTTNTFQAVMYFNGTIMLAWTAIASTDSLVGLSAGTGLPEDYLDVDLSGQGACPYVPGKASSPTPAAGASSMDYDMTLSWTAGLRAVSHNVYLGLTPEALDFMGNQTATTYTPGRLQGLTHYYWRIDEVNDAGVTTGDVWDFATTRLPPDFDADGDVDVEDYSLLQTCFTGSGVAVTATACGPARLDADSDVDGDDFTIFRRCLSGPSIAADSACLP